MDKPTKVLYKFMPTRPGHTVKLGTNTRIKAGQCVYLLPSVGGCMSRMHEVNPETGELIVRNPVKPVPAPVVIIDVPDAVDAPEEEPEVIGSDGEKVTHTNKHRRQTQARRVRAPGLPKAPKGAGKKSGK